MACFQKHMARFDVSVLTRICPDIVGFHILGHADGIRHEVLNDFPASPSVQHLARNFLSIADALGHRYSVRKVDDRSGNASFNPEELHVSVCIDLNIGRIVAGMRFICPSVGQIDLDAQS